MPDQFELPESVRQRLAKGPKRPGGTARRKGPPRDHLISALWALLDGETLAALTGVEKSILLCVAAWAKWATGEVRLSRTSLAKHTGHMERVCRRGLASLVQRGVLEVVEPGKDGRGNAAMYRIPKRGRSGPETGAQRSLNGGACAPPNKDDPRIIQGGSAGAAPPTARDASIGGTP